MAEPGSDDKPSCTDAVPQMLVSSRAVRAAIAFLHANAEQYGIETWKTVCHDSSTGVYSCVYVQAFNTTAAAAAAAMGGPGRQRGLSARTPQWTRLASALLWP